MIATSVSSLAWSETILVDTLEYLLSYGLLGEFGRFRASNPIPCRRGDRAVIRTHRGIEVGQVLCPATPRHARYLPNTTVGQLLRLVTAEDEQKQNQLRQRGLEVLQRAALLADQLQLPLELLDGEMLLDGEHVVLQHLRWGECDVRPLVSTLSREFSLHVLLADLSRPAEPALAEEEEENHGCGKENCGSGGCGRLRLWWLRQLRDQQPGYSGLFRGPPAEDGTSRSSPLDQRQEIYSPLARWGEGSGGRGFSPQSAVLLESGQPPHPRPLPSGREGSRFLAARLRSAFQPGSHALYCIEDSGLPEPKADCLSPSLLLHRSLCLTSVDEGPHEEANAAVTRPAFAQHHDCSGRGQR